MKEKKEILKLINKWYFDENKIDINKKTVRNSSDDRRRNCIVLLRKI